MKRCAAVGHTNAEHRMGRTYLKKVEAAIASMPCSLPPVTTSRFAPALAGEASARLLHALATTSLRVRSAYKPRSSRPAHYWSAG